MSDQTESATRTVTDGGVAGNHPTRLIHSVLVGPSTNGEFNTIEEDLSPEACVRLDDVRFEFESSVIGPEAATELKLLSKLIKEKPNRPASVFGHADPVGDDDYNKQLSGRRAEAMYALLTRKTALWEKLYSTQLAGGSDNWGVKSIQLMLTKLGHYNGPLNGVNDAATQNAVKSFQGSPAGAGLAVDGDPGTMTREKLFAAYMDAICVDESGASFKLDPTKDFLARGVDADGKGDYQGCSEFNPDLVFSQSEKAAFDASANKTQRNRENQPNRRVVIYLFRQGSKVSPDIWPCPRAKEGVAGCKKRFFSDGETRRSNQALRRKFEDTKDTFACRFYDRIGTLSPCESPPPPPPPVVATLEFVFDTDNNLQAGPTDAVTTFARMGLWDHAFDAAGAVLNNEAEANNFIGADTRRFYIRVRDTAASGSIQVNWRTLDAAGNNLDAPATQSLTLTETGAGTGLFASKALMLVTSADDQAQATHSGFAAGQPDAGVRARGQSNHRIRRASISGSVEAEYTPAGRAAVKTTIPVFQRSPNERRSIPLQIFVLRVAAGGAGVIPTAAGSALYTVDLRVIRETYERIGMSVATVVAPGTPAADIVTVGGDSIVLIDPPAGVNPANVSFANETTIGTAHPALANTTRVFFVGGLQSGNGGETWPDTLAPGADPRRSTVFTIQSTGPYAAAHEIGHALSDKQAAVPADSHYLAPTAPAGNRLRNNQNLMRREFLGPESVTGSKRIWDANDGGGFNQFTAMRRSRLTRP